MKVVIIVYEDEDKRDNLKTRMVDTRIDSMVAEFTRNSIPIKVIRRKETDDVLIGDALATVGRTRA